MVVNSKAKTIHLQIDEKRNFELLSAIEIMKNNYTNNKKLPCHFILFRIHKQFFGQSNIL